jgi:hypothetical protein
MIFGVLGGSPRRSTEEGGTLVFPPRDLGGIWMCLG